MNKNSRLQELDLETTIHAARRVGRGVTSVHTAIHNGELPAYVITGRGKGVRPLYLVRPSDVDKLFLTDRIDDLPVPTGLVSA